MPVLCVLLTRSSTLGYPSNCQQTPLYARLCYSPLATPRSLRRSLASMCTSGRTWAIPALLPHSNAVAPCSRHLPVVPSQCPVAAPPIPDLSPSDTCTARPVTWCCRRLPFTEAWHRPVRQVRVQSARAFPRQRRAIPVVSRCKAVRVALQRASPSAFRLIASTSAGPHTRTSLRNMAAVSSTTGLYLEPTVHCSCAFNRLPRNVAGAL